MAGIPVERNPRFIEPILETSYVVWRMLSKLCACGKRRKIRERGGGAKINFLDRSIFFSKNFVSCFVNWLEFVYVRDVRSSVAASFNVARSTRSGQSCRAASRWLLCTEGKFSVRIKRRQKRVTEIAKSTYVLSCAYLCVYAQCIYIYMRVSAARKICSFYCRARLKNQVVKD